MYDNNRLILLTKTWNIPNNMFIRRTITSGKLLVSNILGFTIQILMSHISQFRVFFYERCFFSIDQPYGKILNILHHHIGSSHVVHHVCPTIPHYYAVKLLKNKSFSKAYLFNPMPIHKVWNIFVIA